LIHFVLSLLLLFLGLLSFINTPEAQIIPEACEGQIGSSTYNLTQLALLFSSDATAIDQNNNVYYFRPCQVLTRTECQTLSDATPAMCQRDTRRPPQYHDCGDINSVTWSQLPSGNEDDGFLLSFSGGQEGRRGDIEFICEPSAGAGTLVVAVPTENPQLDFHLKWSSAYACPTNNNSTNSTGLDCCLYAASSSPQVTKTLCLDTSINNQQCQTSLGEFNLIGSWWVDDCSDCFFNSAQALDVKKREYQSKSSR